MISAETRVARTQAAAENRETRAGSSIFRPRGSVRGSRSRCGSEVELKRQRNCPGWVRSDRPTSCPGRSVPEEEAGPVNRRLGTPGKLVEPEEITLGQCAREERGLG